MIDNWQLMSNSFHFLSSHWVAFLVIAFVLIVGIILESLGPAKPPKYQYKLKHLVMTASEFEFFKTLRSVSENLYDIFPQIHLDAILDNKVFGQSWFGAFRHINEKSVDFVLCNKDTGKIILAIELDDRSHERADRIIRDREVESILQQVQLPILRFKNNRTYTQEEVSSEIHRKLNAPQNLISSRQGSGSSHLSYEVDK
jgi:very-short-patch-repair endonuclease